MVDVGVSSRTLSEGEWTAVRLEYETGNDRLSLRELADKHGISRSTIFKRAARENWEQNAALVAATRKQIVQKMEAKMEAATSEAAELVAKQVVEELQPWMEQEKAEHIRRAVAMGKRGFERIERLWDETEAVDPKQEQFAASTLDRHDTIVRRNLGMSDNEAASSTLNLAVLTGVGVTRIQIAQTYEQNPNIKTTDS
jgi:DNA-binding transcriptional regulator YhcF (GntR family)